MSTYTVAYDGTRGRYEIHAAGCAHLWKFRGIDADRTYSGIMCDLEAPNGAEALADYEDRNEGIEGSWLSPCARAVKVGDPATMIYPDDRYPMVVIHVSASGKTVHMLPVVTPSKETGHEPAYRTGPWPVWDHTYSEEEWAQVLRTSLWGRGDEVGSDVTDPAVLAQRMAATLTDAPWAQPAVARLAKDGLYWTGGFRRGIPYRVGEARYRRDYSL